MKKYTIAAMFLAAAALAAALDLDPDVWSIDPQEVVSNQMNKLVEGRVVETSGLFYYGNWIQYVISVKKDKPNDWYVYYQGLEDKAAFSEFLNDVIRRYTKDAVLVLPSTTVKDDETETALYILHRDGRSLTIYTKEPRKSGIRGFGITNVYPASETVPTWRIVNHIDGKTILSMDKFDSKKYLTDSAYVHSDYISDTIELKVSIESPDRSGHRLFIDSGIVISKDISVPIWIEWNEGAEKYKQKLLGYILHDGYVTFINLAEDSVWNSIFTFDSGKIVGFRLYFVAMGDEVPLDVPLCTVHIGNAE